MGLFNNLFGKKKTYFNLNEFARIASNENWSSQTQMNKYETSLYVHAAISKIATKVASIDLTLNEITNSKGEIKNHPAHEILDLLYRVNPFQTRTEFWKITMINKKLTVLFC
jgi:phage portal protein BeeE